MYGNCMESIRNGSKRESKRQRKVTSGSSFLSLLCPIHDFEKVTRQELKTAKGMRLRHGTINRWVGLIPRSSKPALGAPPGL